MAGKARKELEEKADRPIRLTRTKKAELLAWMAEHHLKTQNDGVSVLLQIARLCEDELEITINTESSVALKGR